MSLMLYIIGLTLFGVGTLLTLRNFYLSFIRYPLHCWCGGTRENFRWESGIPLFGVLLLWIAACCLLSQPLLVWSAVMISLFDTGGLHWFVGAMIYRKDFYRATDDP